MSCSSSQNVRVFVIHMVWGSQFGDYCRLLILISIRRVGGEGKERASDLWQSESEKSLSSSFRNVFPKQRPFDVPLFSLGSSLSEHSKC